MPSRVCDQALDGGFRSRPIADPEEHGRGVDQNNAQSDWMGQRTCLIERLPRKLRGPIGIALNPQRASQRDQSTDAVTMDQVGIPRRLRMQYCLAVLSGAMGPDEMVGNAEHPIRHERSGRITDRFGDGFTSPSEGECAVEISDSRQKDMQCTE